MAAYQAPTTVEGRISDFNSLVDEFKNEYASLIDGHKKVSGYRSRKALLSIAKLTKLIRKDIQQFLANGEQQEQKVEETKGEETKGEETKEQQVVEETKEQVVEETKEQQDEIA